MVTESNLITLVTSVGTILASGVVSAIVTFRLNRAKDQFVFMREKAEGLYLAADAYGRVLAGHSMSFFPVASAKIEWNDMLDAQIADGSKPREHGGAETMTMLVRVYFPSVEPALDGIFIARDKFNKFTHEMKRTYRREGELNPTEWMPRLLAETDAISKSIKSLQEATIEAARRYARIRK